MKIYTKTGDSGLSYLYDGNRISKNSLFFEVLGNIDELSSNIGLLFSFLENSNEEINLQLRFIQKKLQNIGTEIATVDRSNKNILIIDENQIKIIEEYIDNMEKVNSLLTKFILPGVEKCDAQCHICRTICRRVERSLWGLQNEKNIIQGKRDIDMKDFNINTDIFKFVNRLSDYFFVLSRYICTINNIEECII